MEEVKRYFEKAGAIIVRDNGGVQEILLEYRGREDLKDWTFPKGGIEEGETPEETAKREIMEETGLEVEIIKTLPDSYYHAGRYGEAKTYMFLAKPTGGKIKPEFDRDKVEWVPIDKASERLSYQNLKDYFESVKDDLNVKETSYGKN